MHGTALVVAAILFAVAGHADELPRPAVGELTPVDATFHDAATRIIHLSDVARYEEALALCDSLRSAHPDHPAPFLSTAAIYVSWMQSHRLNPFEEEVEENAQKAIDTGTRRLESGDDPWVSFYVGSAYGYRALARLRRHNWIGAFLDGRRSMGHLRSALEQEPRLYDAYFALGGYHYWRTARSDFLRTVAFWMRDRRALGLRQMQLAVDHGRYIRTGALHGLALAYYDAGDFDKALALNDVLMETIEPPTNGTLYMRGRLAAQQGDWSEVEANFRRLLGRLTEESVGYQVECKYWIAQSLNKRGQTRAARHLAGEAIEQARHRQASAELESALDDFDTVHSWLRQLDESLTGQSQIGRSP